MRIIDRQWNEIWLMRLVNIDLLRGDIVIALERAVL